MSRTQMIHLVWEGRQYVFQNEDQEEEKMFHDRCMFCVKNQDVYTSKAELVAMSHLWVQKKYLQVSYDDTVERQLQKAKSIYAVLPSSAGPI